MVDDEKDRSRVEDSHDGGKMADDSEDHEEGEIVDEDDESDGGSPRREEKEEEKETTGKKRERPQSESEGGSGREDEAPEPSLKRPKSLLDESEALSSSSSSSLSSRSREKTDSSKDRPKSSSSSSSSSSASRRSRSDSKEHKKSHRDRDEDKDKDRDRDRKHRSHHSKDDKRSRSKERDRSRDRDRHRDKDKDGRKSSRSRDRHRHKDDKTSSRSKSPGSHRDRDRHRTSSSSSSSSRSSSSRSGRDSRSPDRHDSRRSSSQRDEGSSSRHNRPSSHHDDDEKDSRRSSRPSSSSSSSRTNGSKQEEKADLKAKKKEEEEEDLELLIEQERIRMEQKESEEERIRNFRLKLQTLKQSASQSNTPNFTPTSSSASPFASPPPNALFTSPPLSPIVHRNPITSSSSETPFSSTSSNKNEETVDKVETQQVQNADNEPPKGSLSSAPSSIVPDLSSPLSFSPPPSSSLSLFPSTSSSSSSSITTPLSPSGVVQIVPDLSPSRADTIPPEQEVHKEPTSVPLFDMFSPESTPVSFSKSSSTTIVVQNTDEDWDDEEGHLKYRFGELFNGRFLVVGFYGKGAYSTVLKATDNETGATVAIKINRNRPATVKAAAVERDLLQRLQTEGKSSKYILRLFDSFMYRKHLCLVLESMHMNLRDVTKMYGKGKGISLEGVKNYFRQLLHGLYHMKKKNVLHADIKPDNIVVSQDFMTAKLCDFGTGTGSPEENEITPNLGSRFYRAPEIIMGLPYDYQIDVWSLGCCVVEMYTGKVFFQGWSNNDMLRLFMELKGPFPKKMRAQGMFSEQHFSPDGTFLWVEKESSSTSASSSTALSLGINEVARPPKKITITSPKRDVLAVLSKVQDPGDAAEVRQLSDLLEKMFVLNPSKRITVEEALKHPFVRVERRTTTTSTN